MDPGGGLVGAANKKATDTAEQSLELLLQMFGKDGGAYLRKDEQRSCRDMPMLISFSLYWLCMLYVVDHATEEGDIDTNTDCCTT